MTSLAEVSYEIARRVEEQRRRRRRVLHQRRLLADVDALLSDLEELHLAGKRRVPLNYAARLGVLDDSLPEQVRRPLRTGVTIVHLMDELFDIQADLLRAISPFRLDERE